MDKECKNRGVIRKAPEGTGTTLNCKATFKFYEIITRNTFCCGKECNILNYVIQ